MRAAIIPSDHPITLNLGQAGGAQGLDFIRIQLRQEMRRPSQVTQADLGGRRGRFAHFGVIGGGSL